MDTFRETEELELKKSTSELKEAVISIASILNKHQKGELYFGIKNDGTIVGQTITENTIREVSKAVADNLKPEIYPTIRQIKIENKDCVLVEFSGSEIPYYAYGRAYIRVGDEDRQVSPAKIKEMVLYANKSLWEEQYSEKTFEDINVNALEEYIKRANEAKRINFKYTDAESTLRKLNLVKEGKLLKAAEVLFCDNNRLEVQAAVFAGKDKLTFLDIRQFKGNIFTLLDESENYIKTNMRWRVKFGKLEREEIPEVPIDAIREVLVNSFCHRDYNMPESNYVAVYKDRIEISNPGVFPENRNPEDYFSGKQTSILRNPLIANVLFLSKDIEKWGSGIKRINDSCHEASVKVEFRKDFRGFSVVFDRLAETEAGRLGEKLGEKLGENQQKIVKLMLENKYISIPEIAESIKISTTAVENNIAKLRKNGIVRRIGGAKGGHWEIVNEKQR